MSVIPIRQKMLNKEISKSSFEYKGLPIFSLRGDATDMKGFTHFLVCIITNIAGSITGPLSPSVSIHQRGIWEEHRCQALI